MVSNAKKGLPFLRLKPIQYVEPLSVHRLFTVKFALKGFLIILHPLTQQNALQKQPRIPYGQLVFTAALR
jgi:hypothetical protein